MPTRVFFVDWDGPMLRVPGACSSRVASSSLREELAADPGAFHVIVLGDEALEPLDPPGLRRAIGRARVHVLVSPASMACDEIAERARADPVDFVRRERLPTRLRAVVANGGPPCVELREVVQPVPRKGSKPRRILVVLVAMDRPTVNGWYPRAGFSSRHALGRFCLKRYRLRPTVLCRRVVEARAGRTRRAGATWEETAAAVEFSDGPTLRRSYHRRRKPLPPRGPRREREQSASQDGAGHEATRARGPAHPALPSAHQALAQPRGAREHAAS